uniref:Glucose transporter rco-3 n=1 Tax=Ganoderma boninense TaxID=34458 RepID=A0A5K1K6A6_9APHY|nr:Glucose transporter rco-3 [Ganoderma boninense]
MPLVYNSHPHLSLLLIEYVASTATGHDVDNAILRKDKSSLPMPLCCWRYRPTKAYFMYTVKWSVLQYVILRPALSIAGIICEHYGVLCQSGPWSFKTAHAYFSVIDFISITVALYGLLLFYGLTKDELVGRKPLSKFLSIKLIVMFTFYQSFVFSALEGKVIKKSQYWTATNIADGLNALTICIEMVIFSAFMMYAYTWKEYVVPGRPKTGFGRPLLDSVNYGDFAREIWGSLKFFIDYVRGKPGTHGARVTVTDMNGNTVAKKTYGEAFGFERSASGVSTLSSGAGGYRGRGGGGGGESMSMSAVRAPRGSFDENVRLAPYTYSSGNGSSSEGLGHLNEPSVENVSVPRY